MNLLHRIVVLIKNTEERVYPDFYLQGKNLVKLNQKEKTTTISYKRILRFDKIKTNGIRIVFDSAMACPCINNVSAYYLSLNSQLFIRVRDATRLTLRTLFLL